MTNARDQYSIPTQGNVGRTCKKTASFSLETSVDPADLKGRVLLILYKPIPITEHSLRLFLPPAARRNLTTQPVSRNFPVGEPFDKAYATPERVQAALYDTQWPAEISEDAWGFGMTVHWLLTGRDDSVPGSDVMFGAEKDVGSRSDGVTCIEVRDGARMRERRRWR